VRRRRVRRPPGERGRRRRDARPRPSRGRGPPVVRLGRCTGRLGGRPVSATAGRDAPAPTSAGPVGPPLRTPLRRWVRLALVCAGILLVLGVIAIASSTSTGYLDPDAANPAGGRALRVLLEDQGVTVVSVRTTDDAVAAAQPGTTLFVADAGQLTSEQ